MTPKELAPCQISYICQCAFEISCNILCCFFVYISQNLRKSCQKIKQLVTMFIWFSCNKFHHPFTLFPVPPLYFLLANLQSTTGLCFILHLLSLIIIYSSRNNFCQVFPIKNLKHALTWCLIVLNYFENILKNLEKSTMLY